MPPAWVGDASEPTPTHARAPEPISLYRARGHRAGAPARGAAVLIAIGLAALLASVVLVGLIASGAIRMP